MNKMPDGQIKGREHAILRQIAYYLKQEQLLKPEEFIRMLKMIEKSEGSSCGQ